MECEDTQCRLAGAGAELEDRPGRKARSGIGDRFLELLITRDLGGDHVRVGVGVPVSLDHASTIPPGTVAR
jgi:hypothetical protein